MMLGMFRYDSLEDLRSVARENLYADVADRKKLLDQLERIGRFGSEEILYKRKDGTTFWGLARATTVDFALRKERGNRPFQHPISLG